MLTEMEIRALYILAGRRPPEPGAWFNAACEFLAHDGYATRLGDLTEKGRKFINDRLDTTGNF